MQPNRRTAENRSVKSKTVTIMIKFTLTWNSSTLQPMNAFQSYQFIFKFETHWGARIVEAKFKVHQGTPIVL